MGAHATYMSGGTGACPSELAACIGLGCYVVDLAQFRLPYMGRPNAA